MKSMCSIGTVGSPSGLCEVGATELRSVEGGFLAILIGMAGNWVANKLTKMATEDSSDPYDIPIEPLT